jgi:hypothetical protein
MSIMENKVSVSVSQEYFERMAQKKSNHLEEDDIKALSTYLNDPVSSGLWRLNAS